MEHPERAQCTSEGTEAYFKTLFDLAHELDPQKRPRTYAIVMMSLPHNSKGQQFADFISLNRYYGWYVMGGMGIVDAEAAFRKEMDGWAKVLNGRPMIFTEYGADTMPTEHKLPSVMWSQEYQNEYLDMNHNSSTATTSCRASWSGTLQTSRPPRASCAPTATRRASSPVSVSRRTPPSTSAPAGPASRWITRATSKLNLSQTFS